MQCGQAHTRSDFIEDFNEWQWKRENNIRRKVMDAFNKTREDFPNADEFNKYLEDREDMSKTAQHPYSHLVVVMNLVEGTNNKDEIEKQLAVYRRTN